MIDELFQVEVLSQMPKPQTTIWQAMHQDYSEGYAFDQAVPTEQEAGELIVKHLLNGGRGHYGPIEHPQIVFNAGWFPHSMNSWGGTRCPGCGIEVEPQWVLPFKIEYGDGWIRGQNTACSGPGRNFVKCPGEWDWY